MPIIFRPNSYSNSLATAAQTARALSVIKLFKAGFEPTPDTLVAEYDTNECDYSDYAPETITAWLDPAAAQGGGWRITAPTSQFLCVGDQAVGNMVGGFWIELAGGDVILATIFDEPTSMSVNGDFVQVAPTEVFGAGT